jgi:hypothetical protein
MTDRSPAQIQVRAELIRLEEQGWSALASDAASAVDFYKRILDDPVVMLLPGGLVLDDRQAILAAMGGPPWSSYELSDWRVLHPAPDCGVVTYRVVAQRAGGPPYRAVISSLYGRRPDGWKLVLHQQTPL